jgi:hypothetical protein
MAMVKHLRNRVFDGDRDNVEWDLNACNALILKLYDHAALVGLETRPYDDIFIEMQSTLMDIEHELSHPQNRSFWGKLAESFKFVIHLILWFVGFGRFPHSLLDKQPRPAGLP